ncbi:MAG: hypothetical protein WB048_02620, partial [Pseudolabrys sp.]
KAELKTCATGENALRTIQRFKEILFDDTQALRSLGQGEEAPSVIPPQEALRSSCLVVEL